MTPKCFLFLLPDYCVFFVSFFVNKAEELPEHINFSNRGGGPLDFFLPMLVLAIYTYYSFPKFPKFIAFF